MRTSRILLLIAAGAVVGFSIFGALVYRAIDVEEVATPEALRRFAAVRAALNDATPMLVLDGSGAVIRRADPPLGQRRPLERLGVLTYRAREQQLIRADVPFWFFALKGPALQFALRGTGLDLDRLQLTAADLERHGPGLIIDQTGDGGDRLLVWTE